MPEAARLSDQTSHASTPLAPGPGSPDVMIGFMPAWRALAANVATNRDPEFVFYDQQL